jgi:tetratricopeptide (TPR) repeat protein
MKKRYWIPLFLAISINSVLSAQDNTKGAKIMVSESASSLISRALIAGISDYINIDDLQFAHSDALAFYRFLRSPAGGSVDSSDIMLLLNEKATSANFFAGLDWLLSETGEGETVAIYFSGHGDLETKTIRQNGFLLSHDSPRACYMAGAIGIGYVQDYLATLVSNNKAKVIMISDACRSGKLTGGAEGLKNTTAALAEQWDNITKILSSQAGELSMESTKWGGGAGVFTFYLIRGMMGMADRNRDKMVNLLELNIYLNDNVPGETNFTQNPMVDGKQNSILAYVDSLTLLALQKQSETSTGSFLTSAMKGTAENIKEQLEPQIFEKYEKFEEFIKQGRLINDVLIKDTLNADYYYEMLISDARAEKIHARIRRTFLSALQNKTQQYINSYVKGKDLSDTIDLFQAYLEQKKALEMVDSTFILFSNIKARYLFLESLFMRDKMKSLELLEKCILIEPDAAFAWNEMGVIYIEFRDYDQAEKAFKAAIELAPNWSYPYNNLGIVYYKMKQFDKSIEYYKQAIDKDGSSVNPYSNLGNLYIVTGDTSSAIQYYNKAIAVDGTYKDAYLNLAAVYIHKGKFSDAEKVFLQCAEDADPFSGYYYLGDMYFIMQDYASAEKYYKEALHYNPADEKTLVDLGNIYNLTGRYDESVESCRKATEINPAYSPAYEELGLAYLNLKQYRMALDKYFMSMKYDSLSLSSLFYISHIYLSLNKKDSAMIFLNKALKLDPENEIINSSIGDLKFFNNDFLSAIYYYKESVRIDPTYKEVWYSLGMSYAMTGDMVNAILCYQKCVELSPENPEYLTSLALTYLITGRYDESRSLFLKSIESDPDNILNYYSLASLCSLQEKGNEGLEWLEKAFEKGFNNFEYLEADPAMENVRKMENYPKLIEKYIKK